jgi:hypothetical protein
MRLLDEEDEEEKHVPNWDDENPGQSELELDDRGMEDIKNGL